MKVEVRADEENGQEREKDDALNFREPGHGRVGSRCVSVVYACCVEHSLSSQATPRLEGVACEYYYISNIFTM